MRFTIRLIFLFIFASSAFGSTNSLEKILKNTPGDASKVSIYVPYYVLEEIAESLNGRDITTISDFDGFKNRRDSIEFVLLYQALLIGGIPQSDIEITQIDDTGYKRIIKKVRSGAVTMYSSTIWREEVEADDSELVTSSATLSFGESVAGVYMNPTHPKFYEEVDLSNLTAVSNNQWEPDWLALEALGLKRLYDVVDWHGMFQMVHMKRVDFMLIHFSTKKDFTYTHLDMTLQAKPGVKVKLHGSRGWVVSKKNKQGMRAYNAIEKGVVSLRELGKFKKAYIDSGVTNPLVESWQVLNNASTEKKAPIVGG